MLDYSKFQHHVFENVVVDWFGNDKVHTGCHSKVFEFFWDVSRNSNYLWMLISLQFHFLRQKGFDLLCGCNAIHDRHLEVGHDYWIGHTIQVSFFQSVNCFLASDAEVNLIYHIYPHFHKHLLNTSYTKLLVICDQYSILCKFYIIFNLSKPCLTFIFGWGRFEHLIGERIHGILMFYLVLIWFSLHFLESQWVYLESIEKGWALLVLWNEIDNSAKLVRNHLANHQS